MHEIKNLDHEIKNLDTKILILEIGKRIRILSWHILW